MHSTPSRVHTALTHPVFLFALMMLVLNDHVFKAQWPGSYWTGKLSDVAWLVVTPVVLGALLGWLRVPAARVVALSVTTVAFITLQLWPPLGDIWVAWMGGAHVADPTDLFALPALGLACLCWSTNASVMGIWGRRLVAGVSVIALMATSTAPGIQYYDGRSPCAEEDAWDPDRPLAIAWNMSWHPLPRELHLLAEGIQIWDAEDRPVPFTIKRAPTYRDSAEVVLICPVGGLEPNSTYTWKVGNWPELGPHHIPIPYFALTGRWQFVTAAEGSWTAGCNAAGNMAYVETDACSPVFESYADSGWY